MCTLTHTIKTNARIMSSTIILKFKLLKIWGCNLNCVKACS